MQKDQRGERQRESSASPPSDSEANADGPMAIQHAGTVERISSSTTEAATMPTTTTMPTPPPNLPTIAAPMMETNKELWHVPAPLLTASSLGGPPRARHLVSAVASANANRNGMHRIGKQHPLSGQNIFGK
jgi:hypothetical protein